MSAVEIHCIDDVKAKGGQRCKVAAAGKTKAKARLDRTGGERHACAGERAYKSEFCTGMCATQKNGQRTRIMGCLSETI